MHGDVVHGEAGVARDHHDALTHALIAARDRHGGEGQIGIAERGADRLLRLALDIVDAIDRIGARHLHDGIDEVRGPDHPDPQAFDADHAGHRPDRSPGFLRCAFGGAVEQGFDGGARHPQPQQRDHNGNRNGGGGIAPPVAQSGERKPDDDGNRAKHVGGEMQRIGGQRLALGIARSAMQRKGAPQVHGDIDQQHDKRNSRDRRRRRAFAQAAPGCDQDAARQHIKQGDDAERGDALELAMAVLMLLVGGQVGDPHHDPGDHGRGHVDRRVQGLGDQREAADGDANHEFRHRHPGAGEYRNSGDSGFGVGNLSAHGPPV